MTPAGEWLDRVGLCSVTLRWCSPDRVLEIAGEAGLRRIEWGADVHAPPGDHGRLRVLGELTRGAGLAVASYGSYWCAGVSTRAEVQDVVAAAEALGAPRVRVWAGAVGTDRADSDVRSAVVAGLRAACAVAEDRGIGLALEFHPDTLTDSVESTLALLEQVDDPALTTYWQPRLDEPTGPAVEGLRRLTPFLAGVHMFSWWPGTARLPLAGRLDLWSAVIGVLQSELPPVDLLLEFVPGDDAAQVADEARTVLDLVGAGPDRAAG